MMIGMFGCTRLQSTTADGSRVDFGTRRRLRRTLAVLSPLCILHCAFCLAPLAAQAADLYVTHLVDGGGAPYYAGAPAGATVTNDLQAAVDLAASGDTIWVEDGFVCDSGETFAGARIGVYRVYAPRKVFIRSRSGAYSTGATIRGAYNSAEQPCGVNAVKGIYLPAGSVLTGFRIVDAASCDATSTGEWAGNYNGATATVGGGISAASGAVVSNCLVSGCACHFRGGGVSGGAYVNCVFRSNTAGSGGGAANGGSFEGCRFEGNSSVAGGAAFNPAFATNCVFVRNEATTSLGGAIGSYNAAMDIRGCVISNNSAKTYGGGVGVQGGSCRISGTFIAGNSAGGYGGGAAADSTVSLGNAEIADSTVTNNTAAGSGGGIYRFNASGCVIACNFTKANGGGAWGGKLIEQCEIVGNVVSNSDCWNYVSGGGVYGAEVVRACRVAYNRTIGSGQVWATTARGGGGGVCSSTDSSAKRTLVVNCRIEGNAAHVNGGGLCNVIGSDNEVVGNFATNYNGGGMWGGSHTNTLVLANRAIYGGGASSLGLGTNCVFRGNFCTKSGGGAYDSTLRNCLLEGNATTNNSPSWDNKSSYGGGLYGGTAYSCLIRGNDAFSTSHSSPPAGNGGGAAGATLVGCVISNNTASSYGGGVNGGSARSCLVAGNTSGVRGGGLYAGTHFNTIVTDNYSSAGAVGYQTYVYNCTVAGNRCAGANTVYGVNSVFFGNASSEGSFSWATNCCVQGLSSITSKGPGNTSAAPKLGVVDGFQYVPLMGSPCRNAGVALAWMTDAGDARSTAQNGRARVLGRAPDIGACESEEIQTILQVR